MRINHNIAALNTYRQLNTASTNQSKSMEKLSSGLRINKAGDDAAGLAISEKMRGQIRGLDMASKNSQDGISMIATAEGALNETHDILQRMRELATQAANDTNTGDDRKEIQKEMNQLTSEINRIGNTTEFNTQKLLKGQTPTGAVTVTATQAGVSSGPVAAVAGKATGQNAADLGADVVGLTGASVSITVGSGTFALSNSDIVALQDKNETDAAAYIADKAVDGGTKLSSVANVSFVGGKLTVEAKTAATGTNVGITVTAGTADTAGGKTKTAADLLGVGTAVTVNGANATTSPGTQGTSTIKIDTNFAAGEKIEVNGKSYTAVATGTTPSAGQFAVGANTTDTATNLLAAIKAADSTVDASSTSSTDTITLKQATATTDATPFEAQVNSNFNATLQIGANTNQSFGIDIKDMRAVALGISGSKDGSVTVSKADGTSVTASFASATEVSNGTDSNGVEAGLDVSNHSNATKSISVLDDAINKVSAERSKLGAYQNRLEHTINNLNTSSENLTAAESRIRDVDMAKEMMTQTKNSILSQAAQAMLAQSNQMPQGVLQLLR